MDDRKLGAVVLQCRRCGAEIPSENIDLGTAVAKCRFCNAVFGFADQVSGNRSALPPMDAPLPRGIEASEHGDELRLVRRWRSSGVFTPLLFLTACSGFVLLLFYMLFHVDEARMVVLGFFVAFLIADVIMAYATVARFLNHTYITVSPGHLRVRHGPLPWAGKWDIDASEIEQLYCVEDVSYSRDFRRRVTRVNYWLVVALRNEDQIGLLKCPDDAEQVIYLEHTIEKHLGIANRPMPGELSC